MMSVEILKIFGVFLMILILVFAGKLWVGASKLENEIEAESRDQKEDEIRGM